MSAKTEEADNCQHDDDKADKVDEAVHDDFLSLQLMNPGVIAQSLNVQSLRRQY